MSYPPSWRLSDAVAAARIMVEHPFAHIFTAQGELRTTRLPFVVDFAEGVPTRLRAHFNASNPQVPILDGAQVMVTFSGRSTYISPHWRVDKSRAGTIDYEEVQICGTAHVVKDIGFFRQLIDNLARLFEPRYAEAGDYPIWTTAMAIEGYIERLFPQVTPFTVSIDSIKTISKLHQQFPEQDRLSIAQHLSRCRQEDARAIAGLILSTIGK
jgi:predicted FMN-binding regulatory protein PaiB